MPSPPDRTPASVPGVDGEALTIGSRPSGGLGEGLARARIRERMFGRVSPPQRLDRYAVLERLGEGGSGLVYAAHDDQLDRKVAIKVLRVQSDPRARGRVFREARALAKLSHPNIVPVFDVIELPATDAAAARDRSEIEILIAMEYIRGQSLAEWNTRAHGWREVLRVYGQAARGLMAAHAAGLVHRDFKPANVILGDDGRVRVLDFGLAQHRDQVSALAVSLPSHASAGAGALQGPTGTGIVGTPLYMPPEQHRGEPSDAHSDQFSFCASIWEALFGRPPFDGDSMAELLEAKQRSPATLPSDAAADVPGPIVAALVRGLSSEGRDRFPDIAALIQALRYDPRVWKRRAAIVGAVAVLGTGAVLSQGEPDACGSSGASIREVWSAAKREEARRSFAATGRSYAASTWRSVETAVDPWVEAWTAERREACHDHRDGVESSDVFDRRSRCLQGALTSLRAHIEVWVEADATTVDEANRAARSLPSLAACRDRSRLLAGTPRPTDMKSLRQLDDWSARLAAAKANAASGHYDRALALADAVVEEYDEGSIDYSPVHAQALLERGSAHGHLAHIEEARRDLEAGALLASEAGEDILFAKASAQLVSAFGIVDGRFDAANTWARLGWAALERGGGDPLVAAALHNNFGSTLERQGRYEEALAQHTMRRDLVIEHWGEDDPMMIHSIINIANLQNHRGDDEAGLAGYRDGLVRITKTSGAEHPSALLVRSNIVGLLVRMGRAQEAITTGLETVEAQRTVLGEDHPSRAYTQTNVALAFVAEKRADEALALLAEARESMVAAFGEGSRPLYMVGLIEAQALVLLERFDEARAAAVASQTLAVETLGDGHADVAHIEELLGKIEFQTKHLELSLRHQRRAVQLFEQANNDKAARSVQRAEARTLLALGRAEQAVHLAVSISKAVEQDGRDENLAETWTVIGLATRDHEGPAAARVWLHRASDLYQELDVAVPQELQDALASLPKPAG